MQHPFHFYVYRKGLFYEKGDIFEGKSSEPNSLIKEIIDIEGQKVIVKNALEGQVVASPLIKRNEIKSKEDFLKSSSHPR